MFGIPQGSPSSVESILTLPRYIGCGRRRMISLFPALYHTFLRHLWHSGDIIKGLRCRFLSGLRSWLGTLLVSSLAFEVEVDGRPDTCLVRFFSPASPCLFLFPSTHMSGVGARPPVSRRARRHIFVGAWRALLPVLSLPPLFLIITVATGRNSTEINHTQRCSNPSSV